MTFIFSYHVSIISTSDSIYPPEYLLDGEPLDAKWMCVDNGYSCDYVYTNFSVDHGLHEIAPISDVTFLAWAYGYGIVQGIDGGAYGFVTGLSGY